MNITLYKATELATFERFVNTDTGEFDTVAFESASMALVDKQRAVVAYAKSLDVKKAMLQAAKANILEPIDAELKRIENEEKFYKNYLLTNMQVAGITKIEANNGSFKASIQNNPPSVVIDDESLIPADYMRVPDAPPPAPDKTLIKQAINDGYEVPGAHLQTTQRLVIK
jgi:hypothetical protein